MEYNDQYFHNADGMYIPACQGGSKNDPSAPDQDSFEKPVGFTLTDLILKLVQISLLAIPAMVRDFVALFLPARRKSVTGQVALVTGGGNGLGKALCLRLAQEGCHIAVADIDIISARSTAKEVQQKYGVKASAFQVDVAEYQSVLQLKNNIEASLGPVDILVNNAGLLALLSLAEGTPEDVQRIINVNLLSHFWTIRLFRDGMIERRRGHIVGISSMLGTVPCARSICYSSTKFGVRGLMQSLADELFLDGLSDCIHTTCVYPGAIATRKQFVDLIAKYKMDIPWNTPELVADKTIVAMLTNKEEIVPCSNFFIQFLVYYIPFIPKSLFRSGLRVMAGHIPHLTEKIQ